MGVTGERGGGETGAERKKIVVVRGKGRRGLRWGESGGANEGEMRQ